MINVQDVNMVFAYPVYNQVRCSLYNPLTCAGNVSVTTDTWIVSQGLSRIPYPLRDDLGCLRIFLCYVSLRLDQVC